VTVPLRLVHKQLNRAPIGVFDDAAPVPGVVDLHNVVVLREFSPHPSQVVLRHLEPDEANADVMGVIGLPSVDRVGRFGDPELDAAGPNDYAVVNVVQLLKAELLTVPREAPSEVADDNADGVEVLGG